MQVFHFQFGISFFQIPLCSYSPLLVVRETLFVLQLEIFVCSAHFCGHLFSYFPRAWQSPENSDNRPRRSCRVRRVVFLRELSDFLQHRFNRRLREFYWVQRVFFHSVRRDILVPEYCNVEPSGRYYFRHVWQGTGEADSLWLLRKVQTHARYWGPHVLE